MSWPASRLMTPLAGVGLLHQLDGLEVDVAVTRRVPHRAQVPPLAVVLAAADEGGEGDQHQLGHVVEMGLFFVGCADDERVGEGPARGRGNPPSLSSMKSNGLSVIAARPADPEGIEPVDFLAEFFAPMLRRPLE